MYSKRKALSNYRLTDVRRVTLQFSPGKHVPG